MSKMLWHRFLNALIGAAFGVVAPVALIADAAQSATARLPRLSVKHRFYVWAGSSTLLVLLLYGWLFGRLMGLLWRATKVEKLPMMPTGAICISLAGTLLALLQNLMRASFAVVTLVLALVARMCHVLVIMLCVDPIGCILLAALCSFGQLL